MCSQNSVQNFYIIKFEQSFCFKNFVLSKNIKKNNLEIFNGKDLFLLN